MRTNNPRISVEACRRPLMIPRFTLLCAVTPSLRQEFLPVDLVDELASAGYVIRELDPAGLPPESFQRALRLINPTSATGA